MGFVDDTSNRTNFFEREVQPTMEEILRLMHHDAQLWNDLLWASGGLLELPKCSYHHIHFQFISQGKPSMIKGRFGPNFVMRDANQEEVRIKQLSVNKSHKTLGCHKDPVGNQIKQLQVLQENCLDFAKVIQSNVLSRYDSTIFYHHIYISQRHLSSPFNLLHGERTRS